VIAWDRGRPARKRASGAQSFRRSSNSIRASRSFAGGTPTVPDNHLTDLRLQIANKSSFEVRPLYHQSSDYLDMMRLGEHIKSGNRLEHIAVRGEFLEIASEGCRIA
jgi:hypothetical protein